MNNFDEFLNETTLESEQLPAIALTRSGIEYDPNEVRWKFYDGNALVNINFNSLPELTKPLVFGLKMTLIWMLENRSPHTIRVYFFKFLSLLRILVIERSDPIEQLTAQDIHNIRSASRKSELDLSSTISLLKHWHRLGVRGVGKDVVDLLDQIKIKGKNSGTNVTVMHPRKGPFTNLEFEAIQIALNDAYGNGLIRDEVYFMTWLFIALGVRPVQLAALKLCDLIVPNDLNDSTDFILNIPRAKQRAHISRDSFKSRPLLQQIAIPLNQYIKSVYVKFIGRIPDPWQAPMFPQTERSEKGGEINDGIGFKYHRIPKELGRIIPDVFKRISVPSERLSEPMPVTARRFRYTFGTRAAEEGLSDLVIAEMLDHSDTNHVHIYKAFTSTILERIDRAMAVSMAPLAQAFKGKIIKSESEASRSNDISSRIVDLRIDQSGAGVGNCGQHSFCGFSAPIACYSCNSFEPWLEGPHESVLNFLLERRKHLLETTDKTIASINDRTILGVAQVIIRCREIKNKLENHG